MEAEDLGLWFGFGFEFGFEVMRRGGAAVS